MNIIEILSNRENEGKKFKVVNFSLIKDKIYTVGKLSTISVLYILSPENKKIDINSTTCKWDFEEVVDSKWGMPYNEDTPVYYIDLFGDVECTYDIESIVNKACNAFLSKDKCLEVSLDQLLYRKIKRFRDENDGESIDWNNSSTKKYYIFYSFNDKQFIVGKVWSLKDLHTIYFSNGDIAIKCLDEIVKPFVKENKDWFEINFKKA